MDLQQFSCNRISTSQSKYIELIRRRSVMSSLLKKTKYIFREILGNEHARETPTHEYYHENSIL